MTSVFFVVPEGVDDRTKPSGGNVYDRRICDGLKSLGWSVAEKAVPGDWPRPDAEALARLASVLPPLPDGSLVMVDGLIGSAAAEILVPTARRLRLVVLVHLPLGTEHGPLQIRADEGRLLSAAAAVITTSAWTRNHLLALYDLDAQSVHIAEPGVDSAEPAVGTAGGGRFLCVAAVISPKGQDVLLAALTRMTEFDWSCTCVGALDRDPSFVDRLRRVVRDNGLDHRIRFVGPRTGADLSAQYATADLLVLASRGETYGMVVTEALARGIPVIATDVGGLPATLGHGSAGRPPGLLVPAGDSDALAAALRTWLCDEDLRQQLRLAALQRRESLTDWSVTSERISRVLDHVR